MTAWRRVIDSDLYYSFTRSKLTVAAAAIAVIFILASLFAPLVAPHNPFDLATVQTIDGDMPPAWTDQLDRQSRGLPLTSAAAGEG